MVLVIDSQIAGISGDMLLAGLVGLGADRSRIIDGVYASEEFARDAKIKKMDFESIKKHGISAVRLVLELDEKAGSKKAQEILECIGSTTDKIDLSDAASSFADSSIRALIGAESRIHGEPADSVHFHETASHDTIVDIVGTAVALDDLNLFDHDIISTPIAVGGGALDFSHGTTSNPAGAILEILADSGITISGGQTEGELATPTGVAMLTSLAKECSQFYPAMKVQKTGYGAGSRDIDGVPNVLKLVMGKTSTAYLHDTVRILETNVDDISGEVIGHLVDRIMKSGAKDITVSPAIGKKGRPTNLISIICDSEAADGLLEILVSETGTLGVRMRDSQRVTVPRAAGTAHVKIAGREFTVRYKTATNSKIEADDIRHISQEIKKSFKETEELIRAAIRKP